MKRVSMNAAASPGRRGIALIAAVAILAVVTVLMTTIAFHMMVNRRVAERQHERIQTKWLARAGVEHALAHLLSDGANYKGDRLELIPNSQVRITVAEDSKTAGIFDVMSEARYPTDAGKEVLRSETRRVRRVLDGNKIRLEILSSSSSPSP